MTEVAFNNNFNKPDVTVKQLDLELDACQAAELEAICKAAADGQLWTSMEKMNSPDKAMGASGPAVGLPQSLSRRKLNQQAAAGGQLRTSMENMNCHDNAMGASWSAVELPQSQPSRKHNHQAAADGRLWTSTEKMNWPDMAMGAPGPAVGLPQVMFLPLGLGVPVPTPVDPNDPKVKEVGKFAVTRHNQQAGTSLMFAGVMVGLKWNLKVLTAYALLILVADGTTIRVPKVLVIDPIIGSKKLLSWND